MDHSNQNKKHVLKETFMSVVDWVVDHNKIVMPLVLVVCVLITVSLAVNANQKEALEKEAEQTAMSTSTEQSPVPAVGLETPEFELEENAHPEINNLVRTYYDAQASGDLEVISSLNTYLNDIEKIRVEEMSKYIESYPVLNVYTKPGTAENTYVAYVYSEVKFEDVDTALPGMQTYYIGLDANGDYFINDGTYDDDIWDYIREITLQDDVVDLNNKVAVEYNELLANDEELNEFIAYLKEKINEDVGEILAEAEQPAEEMQEAQEASEETAEESEQTVTVAKTVRATDVVNIRKSDSENADKLAKAQVGQEFNLLEQKGNGWSKIEYEGQDAYIKSDYLEVVEEVVVEAPEAETEETETEEAAEASAGTVTVKENVRVRKSASTDAEVLGTAYTGEKLELVMKQADGWTKVKYKGNTAYVKSEYVE